MLIAAIPMPCLKSEQGLVWDVPVLPSRSRTSWRSWPSTGSSAASCLSPPQTSPAHDVSIFNHQVGMPPKLGTSTTGACSRRWSSSYLHGVDADAIVVVLSTVCLQPSIAPPVLLLSPPHACVSYARTLRAAFNASSGPLSSPKQ